MPANDEFRCFVGGLPWSTTDKGLEDTFRQFGSILEAKVITDRETGRSRGFGFVTFGDERAMDEAIDRLHGKELEGRPITVNKAMPKHDDENGDRGYDEYRGRGSYGRGSGGGNGDCFRCGRPGHWARDCPEGGRLPSRDQYPSRGDRYESDRHYGGGSDYSGRYGERSDRYEDRHHSGGGYRREGRSGAAYRDRDAYRRSDRSNAGGPIRYDGGYRDRPAVYDRPVGVRGRSSYDRY